MSETLYGPKETAGLPFLPLLQRLLSTSNLAYWRQRRQAFSLVPRGQFGRSVLKIALRPPHEHGSGYWVGDGRILQEPPSWERLFSTAEGEGSTRACPKRKLPPAHDTAL